MSKKFACFFDPPWNQTDTETIAAFKKTHQVKDTERFFLEGQDGSRILSVVKYDDEDDAFFPE